MPYPATPGSRATDTSRAAATAAAETAPKLRQEVLDLLAGEPLTADECAERLKLSVLSVRPRVAELRAVTAANAVPTPPATGPSCGKPTESEP